MYVCYVYRFCLFLRFVDRILKMFWSCGIFLFVLFCFILFCFLFFFSFVFCFCFLFSTSDYGMRVWNYTMKYHVDATSGPTIPPILIKLVLRKLFFVKICCKYIWKIFKTIQISFRNKMPLFYSIFFQFLCYLEILLNQSFFMVGVCMITPKPKLKETRSWHFLDVYYP